MLHSQRNHHDQLLPARRLSFGRRGGAKLKESMTDRRKGPEQPAAPAVMIAIDSAPTSEAKIDVLADIVTKLSLDVHKMKGELAANTYLTKETADGQVEIRAAVDRVNSGQVELKASVDRIDFSVLTDFLAAVSSMKGGIKVLGWLERPAKWVAAVGGAAVLIYSVWNHK